MGRETQYNFILFMVIIIGMKGSRRRTFQAEWIENVKAPCLLYLVRVWDLSSKGFIGKNTQRRLVRYLAIETAESCPGYGICYF